MVEIIASPFEINDIYKLKQAGATTILVGTAFFSVRSASHFTVDQIAEVCALCKEMKLNIYVSVNRFFVEHELPALRSHLEIIKNIGVDGIYFTDMGVYYEAKQLQMHHLLIYSPDTLLTNANDIKAYLDLGIQMCTIANEIPLEDIVTISKKVKAGIEMVVHGHLNMMHSKRNLLSNYMEFLNKEVAVQNRFDLYLMEENREEKMPIVEDAHGTHVFTGFSLASFAEIQEIVSAGILHLRVESLFHTIDEVCEIISDYRAVLCETKSGSALFEQYQKAYPERNVTKGFLYKKTGTWK